MSIEKRTWSPQGGWLMPGQKPERMPEIYENRLPEYQQGSEKNILGNPNGVITPKIIPQPIQQQPK